MTMMTERKRERRDYVWKQRFAAGILMVAALLMLPLGLMFLVGVMGVMSFLRCCVPGTIVVIPAPGVMLTMPAAAILLLWGCYRAMTRVTKILALPEVPPVNPESLPLEEVLLRAADEPIVAQREVLLRAAQAGQETPREELLRVSQGE